MRITRKTIVFSLCVLAAVSAVTPAAIAGDNIYLYGDDIGRHYGPRPTRHQPDDGPFIVEAPELNDETQRPYYGHSRELYDYLDQYPYAERGGYDSYDRLEYHSYGWPYRAPHSSSGPRLQLPNGQNTHELYNGQLLGR